MDNHMKINTIFIFIILAMPACVAFLGNHAAGPDEKLKAENRLMKNNLDLALRENKVFKEENLQHKAETQRLKKEIESLHNDIGVLNRKYDMDMAAMTEQYDTLSDQYDLLKESTGREIQELTDSNRTLEKRMKNEISRLKAIIADQKTDFEKSRLVLEKEFSTRLSSIEASLIEKETMISSMKTEYDDALLQLEKLWNKINTYKAAFGDIDDIIELPMELKQNDRMSTVDKEDDAAKISTED